MSVNAALSASIHSTKMSEVILRLHARFCEELFNKGLNSNKRQTINVPRKAIVKLKTKPPKTPSCQRLKENDNTEKFCQMAHPPTITNGLPQWL